MEYQAKHAPIHPIRPRPPARPLPRDPQVGGSVQQILALQRLAGNQAVVQLMGKHAKAAVNTAAPGWTPPNATEINAMQFWIENAGGGIYNTFVVQRRLDYNTGTFAYFKVGQLLAFNNGLPQITFWPAVNHLNVGLPHVTHLNGMAVMPESGINAAVALRQSIEAAVIGANGQAAINGGVLKMLYTYGATHGATDGLECILGKAQTYTRGIHQGEQVKAQSNIMWDALETQSRVTVSAHSRGTIFTDTAVRNVYNRWVANLRQNQGMSTKLAKAQALHDMDASIQLIYAGNAVGLPSSRLKFTAFVGTGAGITGKDWVSELTGTSKQSSGWRKGFAPGSRVEGIPGAGHNFQNNYEGVVANEIGRDIAQWGR